MTCVRFRNGVTKDFSSYIIGILHSSNQRASFMDTYNLPASKGLIMMNPKDGPFELDNKERELYH